MLGSRLRFLFAFAVVSNVTSLALAAPDVWDTRLDEICGLQLVDLAGTVAPGQGYWRLKSATYEDQTESGGNHHIYVRAQDAGGNPIENQRFFVTYPYNSTSINENVCVQTGSPGWTCADTKGFGGGLDNFFGNIPMWATCPPGGCHGAFNAFISSSTSPAGLIGPSDAVIGMWMTNPRATPCGEHVNFRLTFQWTIASGATGAITGTVRDASNNPLSGATVSVSPSGQNTTTAGNGTYTISNLAVGTYTVTASKSGYTSQVQSNVQVPSGGSATVNFNLTQGGTTGTISGTITDANNSNPINGATVQTTTGGHSTTSNASDDYTLINVTAGSYTVEASATGYQTNSLSNVVVNVGQTTDADVALTPDGQPISGITNRGFESGFHNDPDGDHQTGNSWTQYTVTGNPKFGPHGQIKNSGGFSQSFWEANYVTGLYQQATNGIVGNLYRGSVHVYGFNTQVTFKVGIDPNGGTNPTSGNIIWSPQANPGPTWTQIAVEATAASQTITLFLKAQNPAVSSLPSYFDDADLVDLGIAPPPTSGSISGTVRDSGNNIIVGAIVEAEPGGLSDTTDNFGAYEFTLLPPDTYEVTVTKIGFVSETESNIVVGAGDNLTRNFNLVASQPVPGFNNGGFEGGFFNDPDPDHRTGNGWSQFTTSGFSKSGGNGTTNRSGSWSQSFWEGPYTSGVLQNVSGVTPGNNYRASGYGYCSSLSVTFQIGIDPTGGTSPTGGSIVWGNPIAPGSHWGQMIVETTAASTSLTLFVKIANPVTASINSYIDDIQLENLGSGGGPPPTTGTISGTVLDTSSNPISGATVSTSTGGYSTTTNAAGAYTLNNVTAGTYNVTAAKTSFNPLTVNNVAVTGGGTTTVNFNLAPTGGGPTTGTISGTVKDNNTSAISGATVSTNTGGYSTTTNATGDYTLNNVAPGTYAVTASHPNFVNETQTGVTITAGGAATVNFNLDEPSPFQGLTNGGFENGFHNDPDGDHRTGNDWTQFTTSGFSKSGGNGTFKHGGSWSQSFWEASWISGIYQEVSGVTPGHLYTVCAWVRGDGTDVVFWVGIDPNGGTDPAGADLMPTPVSTNSAWSQICHQVEATGSTLTVFVRAQNNVIANRNAYIDDVTLTDDGPGAGGGPPVILSAGSRKTHGGAGEFDVPLGTSPGVGDVECRENGPTLVVVAFDQAILPEDGTLNAGDEVVAVSSPVNSVSITGLSIVNNDELHVLLSNAPAHGCLTLALQGIAGNNGGSPGTVMTPEALYLKVSTGDVSNSGKVTSADVNLCRSQLGGVTETNFRSDLDTDGTVAAADIGSVKANTQAIPVTCP